MKVILCLCFLLFQIPVFSQALNDTQVEGVCFFNGPSINDAAASAFEYRTVLSYPHVSYVIAVGGRKVRVGNGCDAFFVPYPGRDATTPEVAMILIKTAQARFPQYATLLANIKTAWRTQRSGDPAGAARRQALAQQKMSAMAPPSEPSHTPFVRTSTALAPASLKGRGEIQSARTAEKASPAGTPRDIYEYAEKAPKPAAATDPNSLKKNLDFLKYFYNFTNFLGFGGEDKEK